MKALIGCLLACVSISSCVQAPRTESAGLGTHRGAVLSARPEAVWEASKRTLAAWGPLRLEEEERTARATTNEGTITVRIEPYDAAGTRSILRIAAVLDGRSRPELADEVQLAIQRALLAP